MIKSSVKCTLKYAAEVKSKQHFQDIKYCQEKGYKHCYGRPPDKSVYCKIIYFISHPKHMLWVPKRTVSMRQFFGAPKTHV